MKTIKITIEKSKDAFWAYSENVEGINGVGNNVQEVKQSVLDCIEIQKELGNLAKGAYELRYRFDAESFLNYYKGIFSNVAIERITGINRKQIQHYASGLKKPRSEKRKKITEDIHEFAKELLAVEL